MHKQPLYFTPGPTKLHPGAPSAILHALETNLFSQSHRSRVITDMIAETTRSLRTLLNIPEDYHLFYLSSATQSFQLILKHCSRGEALFLVNGTFAAEAYRQAKTIYPHTTCIRISDGSNFSAEDFVPFHKIPIVFCVQNESSTGYALLPQDIKHIKQEIPDALIFADMVSSAPVAPVPISALDGVFFSIQKAFGCPAGLSVLVLSPKALNAALKREKMHDPFPVYPTFHKLKTFESRNQTPETPNIPGIAALHTVTCALEKEGITTIRKQISKRAQTLYRFFERISSCRIIVSDPLHRSDTMIVVETQNAHDIRARLAQRGVEIALGYGPEKNHRIRIANYPQHTDEEWKILVQLLSDVIKK